MQLDTVLQLVATDQRAALAERLRRYLRGEEVADHLETVIVGADGIRLDVELAVKAARRDGSDTILVALVRDATRARRETRFGRILADASEIVAGARDDVDAIRAIVRLIIPGLADWCAFDRHDFDGSLTRIAAAHVMPEGEALLWELTGASPYASTKAICARGCSDPGQH